MSIYDDEGVVNWLVIRREIEGEIPGVTVDLSTGDCAALVEFCDQAVCELFVDTEGFKICCVCPHGDCDKLSTLSSILARVRELAEEAREKQVSTSDNKSPAADEQVAWVTRCQFCGGQMTPDRESHVQLGAGGKAHIACWEAVLRADTATVEQASAEPTLREFASGLRSFLFRYKLRSDGRGWEMAELYDWVTNWLDARLGEEESDG